MIETVTNLSFERLNCMKLEQTLCLINGTWSYLITRHAKPAHYSIVIRLRGVHMDRLLADNAEMAWSTLSKMYYEDAA